MTFGKGPQVLATLLYNHRTYKLTKARTLIGPGNSVDICIIDPLVAKSHVEIHFITQNDAVEKQQLNNSSSEFFSLSTSSHILSPPTVVEQFVPKMTSTPTLSPVSGKKKSSAQSLVPTSPVARRVGLRKVTKPNRYIDESSNVVEIQKVMKMVKKRQPKKVKTVETDSVIKVSKKVKARKATKERQTKNSLKNSPKKVKLYSASTSRTLSINGSPLVEHPIKRTVKGIADRRSALIDFLDKDEYRKGQASALKPAKKSRGRRHLNSSFTIKQEETLRMVFEDSFDPDLLD